MNKKVIIFAAATVVVVSLAAVAGYVYAQSAGPDGAPPYGPGYWTRGNRYGYGMMGGYGPGMMGRGNGWGMMGSRYDWGMMGGWAGGYGPMHNAMFDALASGLGLTRAELDDRIAQGETLLQIAAAQDISRADFTQIFAEAHQAALDSAVANGYLTQEQADWMLNHMDGNGYGLFPFIGGMSNR